jgi:ubiquinone/menaquinone biosynthesis C-methylase UbiE/DNA-binding transcriptional ArsR family regulator
MASVPVVEIYDRLTSLGEPTRARLLLLLESQELTVSELCGVLQAPQSTVSRHLKALADAGWVASRPEGTRRFYYVDQGAMKASMRRLWLAVREEVTESPAAGQDRARLVPVLAQRRSRSKEFFQSEAGEWDRMRDELFGAGFYLGALPGLLDPTWVIGDLGCGTGHASHSLAPFVGQVIAVDGSEAMLDEARRRLDGHNNVQIRHGDLESLPIDDDSLDAAVLALVLHHLPDPGAVMREVARVLRPGGRVLLVDMLPHDREELAKRMGHVWLGLAEETITTQLATAGFQSIRHARLPINPAARGPALFATSAVHAASPSENIKD